MSLESKKQVRVGIGVIITRGNKVLVGKRKNSHAAGSYAFPGGHLEFGETPEQCAIREVLEETGLKVTSTERIKFTNDFFEAEDKHYITLYIKVEVEDSEPIVMEPDKCESWDWYEWDKIPKPYMSGLKNLIDEGFNPFTN